MRAFWKSLCWRLSESRLVCQLTESVLRARSRRHLTRLDQQAEQRCQTRVLLGLLHQARNTRFGREHDFRRIRTPADFRRLVPVRSLSEFWQNYWQPAFPNLADVTWPGPSTHLIGPSPEGPGCPIPLTPALRAVHLAALRTALALVLQNGVRGRLFSGCLLFADDDVPAPLSLLANLPAGPPLVPVPLLRLVNPNTLAEVTPPGITTDEPWLLRTLRQPVTCLAGAPERLLTVLRQARQAGQPGQVHPAWFDLAAVFSTRPIADPVLAEIRSLVGQQVPVLETLFRPEGVLALTDPRHGSLRLLAEHGLYFEFIPALHPLAGRSQLERLSLDQVEVGVPYELVVTAPAGLWACRSGLTLVFDRLNPPLFHLVEATRPAFSAALSSPQLHPGLPATFPVQAPHRQSGGSPAKLPGMFAHNLWSAPVDRG